MTFSRSTSAGYVVNLAARVFARAVDRALAPFGLSSGSLPVFLILLESGPLAQKEITRLAAIEQPTMAATLSRMERDGLVTRSAHPTDRRSTLFSLHPDVLARADDIITVLNDVNARALADVDIDRRADLVADLEKIVRSLNDLRRSDS